MTLQPSPAGPVADEDALVDALLAGDEAAFEELVTRLHPTMIRLARQFVPTDAAAQEAAQEAWVGVLTGLARFERRSSVTTWIMRIVMNRARTRGIRERRMIPFSAIARSEASEEERAVDADRFVPSGERWAGHWVAAPIAFSDPATQLLDAETMEVVRAAIRALPVAQRTVVTLRDVDGWGPEEVCDLLEISDANQRVLLHRGRSRVRAAIERHLGGSPR